MFLGLQKPAKTYRNTVLFLFNDNNHSNNFLTFYFLNIFKYKAVKYHKYPIIMTISQKKNKIKK